MLRWPSGRAHQARSLSVVDRCLQITAIRDCRGGELAGTLARMRGRRDTARGVAVLVVALVVSACSVHVGRVGPSEAGTPTSIVHHGVITMDFRQTPSRAEFALPSHANWRSYEAAYRHVYQLAIVLPKGVLRLPAHSVEGDTDGAGGANDANYSHRPEFFVIDAAYPSEGAADAALAQQYAVLGINQHTQPSTILLEGSPSHSLSVTVQRRSNLTASLQPGERYYYFAFDEYHNAAGDAVLHDGRMSLDVRTRPSRADLGFLTDYAQATIQPVPASTAPITLVLRTPSGVTMLAVESVTSTSGRDTDTQHVRERATPTRTVMNWVSSVAEVRAQLMRAAPILGLAPSAIPALFTGPTSSTRTLHAHTPVYDLQVDVLADPSRMDVFAASVSYTFTYH